MSNEVELPNVIESNNDEKFTVADSEDGRRYEESKEDLMRGNTLFLRQESLQLAEEAEMNNRERDDMYRGDCGGEITRFLSSPFGMIVGFIGFLIALPFIVIAALFYSLAVSTSYVFGKTTKMIKRCKKKPNYDSPPANMSWADQDVKTPIDRVKKVEEIDMDDLVEELTNDQTYKTPWFYNKKDIYLLKFIKTTLEERLHSKDKQGQFQCLKWYVVMLDTTDINAGQCKSIYNLLFKLSMLEGQIESRNEFWFNGLIIVMSIIIGLPEWLSYFEVQFI